MQKTCHDTFRKFVAMTNVKKLSYQTFPFECQFKNVKKWPHMQLRDSNPALVQDGDSLSLVRVRGSGPLPKSVSPTARRTVRKKAGTRELRGLCAWFTLCLPIRTCRCVPTSRKPQEVSPRVTGDYTETQRLQWADHTAD